jgi:hypothetical protein
LQKLTALTAALKEAEENNKAFVKERLRLETAAGAWFYLA